MSALPAFDVFTRQKSPPPERRHAASIGSSELLTGRLDGMNACGLIVGLHLVRTRPRHSGLLCLLIVRMVLDQCATTAEAVALLRRGYGGHPVHQAEEQLVRS